MSRYHKNPEAVSRLPPEQYRVTQLDGTERPFENAYWDNKEPGIYVDVVSGEPLFASIDKFDSSSGSPSFTKPIEPENVIESRDDSHGMNSDRDSLKPRRQPFRTCLSRWPKRGGRSALLHQFRLAALVHLDHLESEGYGI